MTEIITEKSKPKKDIFTKVKELFSGFCIITLLVIALSGSSLSPQKIYVFISAINRYNINKIVGNDSKWYISKYAEHLNRNYYTIECVWKYSKLYNIPFDLSLAVGLQESQLINYNPSRPINYNLDGSYDWGLYQLNSKTYPNVIDKYSSIEANAKGGISHLADEYSKYNSYEVATMTYNCGNPKRIGPKAISRLKEILQYEKGLDEWINDIYRDKVSRAFSSS